MLEGISAAVHSGWFVVRCKSHIPCTYRKLPLFVWSGPGSYRQDKSCTWYDREISGTWGEGGGGMREISGTWGEGGGGMLDKRLFNMEPCFEIM